MTVKFDFLGIDIEVYLAKHAFGRKIQRDFTETEVLSYIELAQEEIIDMHFNEKFAIVSTCRTKGVIGVFNNDRGNLSIDIITLLNTEGTRDLYISKDTKVIYLDECI